MQIPLLSLLYLCGALVSVGSAAMSCVMCFQEEAGKSVLAEFNLGCDVEHTQHVYRVYVTTFLGFGGNMARQRYEDQLVNNTLAKNRFRLTHCVGLV